MNDEDNRRGKWVDGYWNGSLVDGYPASYFDSGRFEFPWESQIAEKEESDGVEHNK